MTSRVLFIDRDGTLIREPDDHQVDALDKVALVRDVIPSLLQLQRYGYRLIMVSNQDGLGTPAFPTADFEQCHEQPLLPAPCLDRAPGAILLWRGLQPLIL